jgi:hypothetical protein
MSHTTSEADRVAWIDRQLIAFKDDHMAFLASTEPYLDVEYSDEGTVVTFQPLTERGKDWIEENVTSEGWQWLGARLCVDPRYAQSLVDGMADAGLAIEER